jgi:hypothetical protein
MRHFGKAGRVAGDDCKAGQVPGWRWQGWPGRGGGDGKAGRVGLGGWGGFCPRDGLCSEGTCRTDMCRDMSDT